MAGHVAELRNAIADNANIKLTADIDLSNITLEIPANNTVTTDLDGNAGIGYGGGGTVDPMSRELDDLWDEFIIK